MSSVGVTKPRCLVGLKPRKKPSSGCLVKANMQYLIILIESATDVVGSVEYQCENASTALRAYIDSVGYSLIQSYWTGSTLNAIVEE